MILLSAHYVVERLENNEFVASDAEAVAALRCVLEAWPLPHAAQLLTRAAAAAAAWPPLVLRLLARAPAAAQEQLGYLQDAAWAGLRLGRACAARPLLAAARAPAVARDFAPALHTSVHTLLICVFLHCLKIILLFICHFKHLKFRIHYILIFILFVVNFTFTCAVYADCNYFVISLVSLFVTVIISP